MLDRSRTVPSDAHRASLPRTRRAIASLAALLGVAAAPVLADEPIVDETASYPGPFGGATGMKEMAQSFEVSMTGFLHGIEAWIPTTSGDPCELVWFLRDGATLDPADPDISSLPVLASGTAMSSEEPDFLYDAGPTVLLAGANVPITEGDVLVLHVVRPCTFVWIAGAADRPGERFESDGISPWEAAEVGGLEYGRTILVSDELSPTAGKSWSAIKSSHR